MITLTIKKQDKSVYWTEYFNDLKSANAQVDDEQTRPYWDDTYTVDFTDDTPPPPTKAELDAIAAKTAAIVLRDSKLAAAKVKPSFTPQEIQDTLKLILDKLG